MFCALMHCAVHCISMLCASMSYDVLCCAARLHEVTRCLVMERRVMAGEAAECNATPCNATSCVY
eukprot:6960049-Alexandrium_andersonii.AAC.1